MSDAAALIALLEGYHITDRSLLRARERAGRASDAATVAALAREIRRYFTAVERETATQLSAIDRRLDDLYQRQYNAQAERAVAQRRLAGARKILGALRAPDAKEAG